MSNDTAIASLKEKIDDLNQLAWDIRVTDLPKAFELSQEAVKLARGINYPKGLAEGLRSLGFSYVRFFKNDEAAPLLKESLSLFQSLNDLKGQAVIYEYLGIIERNWGNLGASLDLLLKAYELVLQTGPLEVEITCSYQLGVTYKHLGNHENALDYLYKTLSLAKKINNPLMEAYATNIIGSIYFDNGNYNEALDCYQQGLPIRRQSHDKWGEAGSLDNIGFTYLKLNDLDKAIEYCKQSLTICQATDDKRGEANALLHLGEIYQQAGDIKQAADFSNQSLEIRKARGDKRGETEVLLFLADLYKNRNDVEDHQIFEWLSDALKIADEIKAQDLLSKAYYGLHEYYQQKGNFKESIVQLESHFQIEKELHKNSINQKIANLEISHKAEVISQRNKELTELNEKIEKANEELKIESSLEKVRSRSLAMHKSEELQDVVSVVFEKLAEFISIQMDGVSILIPVKGSKDIIEWVASEGKTYPEFFRTPYIDNPILTSVITARDSGVEFLAKVFDYEEKNALWKYAFEHSGYKNLPEEMKKRILESRNYAYSVAFQKNSAIVVASIAGQVLPEDESEILKRFAKVFEQAYIRFLDLQKAEAQSREAKIELGLERVRARAMAMQKSDELAELVDTVFKELTKLHFTLDRCIIIIVDEKSMSANYWMANPESKTPTSYHLQLKGIPYLDFTFNSWKERKTKVVYDLKGDEKTASVEYIFSKTELKHLPPLVKEGMKNTDRVFLNSSFNNFGSLQADTIEPISEDNLDIIYRFAKVFDLTYTRFNDLQKAEAQTREAQIELALERVRARTMAMQKSDELREAVLVIYEQLQQLNFESRACNIIIIDKESGSAQYWVSGFSQEIFPESYNVPYLNHPYQDELLNPWKQGDKYVVYEYTGKMKQSFDEIFFTQTEFRNIPEEAKKVMIGLKSVKLSTAFISYGALQSIGAEALSEENANILQRFAKVFEQTYTRFLDLQKAEAQAREAQIQLSLERVRARGMAMHSSNELAGLLDTVFKELTKLDVRFDRCLIMIYDPKTYASTWWLASPEPGAVPVGLFVKYHENKPYLDYLNAWKERVLKWEYLLEGDNKKEWDSFVFKETELSRLPEFVIEGMKSFERIFLNASFNNFGSLTVSTSEPLDETNADLLLRFAKVFDSTYTRFNDLKQAEAQAREAQIETALERVRSRSMGMQKSEELKDVIQVVYDQFVYLNIKIEHTGFVMDYKTRDDYNIWIADPLGVPSQVTIPYFDSVYYNRFNEAKKNGEDFFATNLSFEEKNKFYQKLFEYVPGLTEDAKKFYFSCPGLAASTVLLDNVCLYIENFSGTPYSDEENKTLMRFGKVFQQTYTRFLDLQKAEVQAREANIEAALEKVRSRTLAMQKSDELAETAAEVFRQLIGLGIEPNRLYIGIVKEETGDMEMWATDEDGTQVGKRFMFNKNENASVLKLYDGWKTQKKSVIVDMQGKELEDYFHYLNNVMHIPFKGGLTQKRRVQSVAYFSKGFIGMASPDGQGDDTIQLLERFAAVFNLTFTRFNDLKLAEAHALQAEEDLIKLQREKKRAEDALSELQVTQKQLIQSEKMASLGELTAGIAHEIQNPLNFVNNFSDVNKELLVEMKEEIEKGNIDEVIAIANDIISNEEKINHHGKRADAIVKGMLQHSRSSSGVKELTDINELADEFLRLAYHGLRAKDKSFNATMKTDFDEAVGKVNIIPQDIGRVFLNLITNAFYVVAEKKKQLANGYEPTVTVTTKKESDKVVVSIKDNGSGIPQKVLDKIFQPFFTTKPTGQGTGLGLSLSYDIVKAHSGEIKVKTKDGEGSEFVIQLPVV